MKRFVFILLLFVCHCLYGQNDTTVYTTVEQMPEFPGGQTALIKYIQSNIKYDEANNDIYGTVYITFVVEKDGTLTNITIIRPFNGPSPNVFNTEALRVVKSMPKWKAGMQNGKPVRVTYNLPIKFILH